MVRRRADGEIAWCCDTCGDDGVIRGWEHAPTDLSHLTSDADETRDLIAVAFTRAHYRAVSAIVLLDDDCELAVAGAEGTIDGVVMTGTTATIEELIGFVAAEANNEPDRRRRRILEDACACLEAAVA
jgi:hypothetical protein